jgi:protein-S-isoprenylcysteine O-methyltransferase Ste14
MEFMPDNLSQTDSDSSDQSPRSSRGTSWVLGQVLLFILFFASVIEGSPPTDLPGIVIVEILGVALAIGGAALGVWAVLYHGSSLTPFPKPIAGQQVIDAGPYRYVRHPMYSGIIAFTLGVGLAYVNPVTMLSSVAFSVFFMAKSGHEESMLVAEVPGYRQYRATVHWRLIPFVM